MAPTSTHPRVICVGHAALDRVFAVQAWPQASGKIAAHRYEEAGGGMAGNAAAAIARLGARAAFWGPTGDDEVAPAIRRQFDVDGVDAAWLRPFPGRSSSHSAVVIDARGERLVVGVRGTALQAPADWLPLQDVASADALLADVRWPQGARVALQAARKAGIPGILDGEVAEPAILDDLLGCAAHVIFSQRGLEAWAGPDVHAGLRMAIDRQVEVAAVTHGENGVEWIDARDPARVQHCPAFAVPTVDTLAAGDVFHGAYALALAEAATVGEAMRFASAAAAIKCSRHGGRSGAPTRREVEALLAR